MCISNRMNYMRNVLIGLILLVLAGAGAFVFLSVREGDSSLPPVVENNESEPTEELDEPEPSPFTVVPAGSTKKKEQQETIGTSVEGNDITAYHFGTGDTEVLFVGGIHGGFAPNTVAVMDTFVTALMDEDIVPPDGVMVTVIPNLNPDASGEPNTLASRLNANDVDLNRNFNCEWEAEGVWRSSPVSGGDAAFSEPEAAALRDYIEDNNIAAAVVYYAAAGGVYASNCGGTLDPEIAALTAAYADASGYTAHNEFDAYKISGDATNWMAKVGVPAIGVLMGNYTSTEWPENLAGIKAILEYYANKADQV